MHVTIAPNGRMSLPAAVRKRLGIGAEGGVLLVEETADGLVLRTTAQAVARAQAFSRSLTGGRNDATVDDFLAERRQWQD